MSFLQYPLNAISVSVMILFFHQNFKNGLQSETPDFWLGNHDWAVKTEKTYPVSLAGTDYTGLFCTAAGSVPESPWRGGCR